MKSVTTIPPSNTDAPLVQRQRVAAYARVSSASEEQLHSYQSQVRHYLQLITENSQWEYAGVYADEGLTGTSADKRRGFQQMLKDCRNGKIDRILVKSISRFARNITDTLCMVHELKRLGVSVLFEAEALDTATMSSEMLLTLYGMNAQRESLSISSNMRQGLRMKMKNGNFLSSSSPYGYVLNKRVLIIHADETKVVERIFDSYLSGKGVTAIANMLNVDRIVKRNGKQWHAAAVRYILSNLSYTGDMLWQKSFSTGALPFQQVENTGQCPQYHVRNHHEAIISHEDFQKVQELLLLRKQTHYRVTPSHKYMLSKRVLCAHCGKTYRRKITNGTVYWVCRNHDANKDNCPSSRIPEPLLLEACMRMYNKLRRNYQHILCPMIEQLQRMQERRNQNDPELKEINSQLAELSEQVHIFYRLMSKESVEPALYVSQIDKLNGALGNLKSTKQRIMEGRDSNLLEATEELIDVLEEGPAHIFSMDEDLFDDLVDYIHADTDEKIHIRLCNGLKLQEQLQKGNG